MKALDILFFGSSCDSVIILDAITQATFSDYSVDIHTVVTQPPRPIGRKHVITSTPVELWAKEHSIPVLHFQTKNGSPTQFEDEQDVIRTIQRNRYDLIISASYGQLIPWDSIQSATFGGINIHPSLLPRWRGADPIPWSILASDAETGVSIVSLSKQFDEGKILAQQSILISSNHQREPLRKTLFTLGAKLLSEVLISYVNGSLNTMPQDPASATYARRLQKEDGFLPWGICTRIINKQPLAVEQIIELSTIAHISKQLDITGLAKTYTQSSVFLDHFFRALSPWPGVWTIVPFKGNPTRMNIRSITTTDAQTTIETVQLEGKLPTLFSEINKYIQD